MTTHEHAEQLERAMELYKEWHGRLITDRAGTLDAFLSGYGCGVADTEAERTALREALDNLVAHHGCMYNFCPDCRAARAALAEGEKP